MSTPALQAHRDPSRPGDNPETWVVVPAFNEAGRIVDAIRPMCDRGYQIVVVDDGSKDGTSKRVGQMPVWLLRHPFNCGQGAALRTGIEFALSRGADFVVTFDADGQHDFADIGRLLAPLHAGRVDVALGTRFGTGAARSMPLSRRWLLKAAVAFTRLTTGLDLSDSHNGFRAFSRKAAQAIRIQQPRMAHASEILDQIARHELSFEEVPVTITYTTETLHKGQSTWDAVRIGGQLILDRFVP